MKTTISNVKRLALDDGRSMISFSVTFEWQDEDGTVLAETHKRAIAGVGQAGPWLRPPTPNKRFPTTAWNKELKDSLLAGLKRHGLLDGLERVWPEVPESTEVYVL